MSSIKAKDTTLEHIVRSFLHRNGFRKETEKQIFRNNLKEVTGQDRIFENTVYIKMLPFKSAVLSGVS